MESCQGNRSPERGHYSNNNSRNQNRQGYRRSGSSPQSTARQNMMRQEACRQQRMTNTCPSPEPSSRHCDNGAAKSDNACNIAYMTDELHHMPVAMAYVPWQRFNDTYDPCKSLQAGTIFPELDMPFLIGRCAVCK